MEAIKRQALITFKNVHAFEENFSILVKLMQNLTSTDVNLDHRLLNNPVGKQWAPVTYIAICDHEQFTISMFILRAGSKLPLHDHPLMHGICKVIHGKVKMRNYSFVGDPTSYLSENHINVMADSDKEVSATDPPAILSPTKGNIHEICAHEGPAAFVDVLAPPYKSLIDGYGPRPCNYYVRLNGGEDDDVVEDISKGEDNIQRGALKLVKIPEHPNYWTDVAPYLGPQINNLV